jgi:hypothetical protein
MCKNLSQLTTESDITSESEKNIFRRKPTKTLTRICLIFIASAQAEACSQYPVIIPGQSILELNDPDMGYSDR